MGWTLKLLSGILCHLEKSESWISSLFRRYCFLVFSPSLQTELL